MEENPIMQAQESAIDVRSSLSQMHKELKRMERRKPDKHKSSSRMPPGPLLAPPGGAQNHSSSAAARLGKRRRVLRNVLRHKLKRDAKNAVRGVLGTWLRGTAQVMGRIRMEQRVADELGQVEKERHFMRRLETAMEDLYSGLAEDLHPQSPGSTMMLDTVIGSPNSAEMDGKEEAFEAWTGSNNESMGPGSHPGTVNPRLRATRSLLQVMATEKRNNWLGDRMREDRYNMPIPEYKAVEVQATAPTADAGSMAIAETATVSIQTLKLDHRMVALQQLRQMCEKINIMMMTKCFLQMLANYGHRSAMVRVAKANETSKQYMLKMTVARLMVGCVRTDLRKFSVQAIYRFVDRARTRQIFKLLTRWRSQLVDSTLKHYSNLAKEAAGNIDETKELRRKFNTQQKELVDSYKATADKKDNDNRLKELELEVEGSTERSLQEAQRKYSEGHFHGQQKAALRTLQWGLYNKMKAHTSPAALRCLVQVWSTKSKLEKMIARSLKDVKTHAAKNISRLKADVKTKSNSLELSEGELAVRKQAIIQGCTKMLKRARKNQMNTSVKQMLCTWRSNLELSLRAQLEQAVRVSDQLEEELLAVKESHSNLLLDTHSEHARLLEAKEAEMMALKTSHELELTQKSLSSKQQGRREKTCWALDRMLHMQGCVGTSPTALSLYIINWRSATSKHVAVECALRKKEAEASEQKQSTGEASRGIAIRAWGHCKQRQHEARMHATVHSWYVNMAEDDRATAVKGYKAGKDRLRKDLEKAKLKPVVAVSLCSLRAVWNSRCSTTLASWRVNLQASLLRDAHRAHQATIQKACRERAATMALHLMLRFRKLLMMQMVSAWRVNLMDGDIIDQKLDVIHRESAAAKEIKFRKRQGACNIFKHLLHWYDASWKLRQIKRWSKNMDVGRKVEAIDQLQGKMGRMRAEHTQLLLTEKVERLAKASISLLRSFFVTATTNKLLMWRTKMHQQRLTGEHLRKHAGKLMAGINNMRKLAFLGAARAIAEWRVGTRCGDRMGKVSQSMTDSLENQIRSISTPKPAKSAKALAKQHVEAAKAKVNSAKEDLENALASGDAVAVERASKKVARAEKAMDRKKDQLQVEKKKDMEAVAAGKKKELIKEAPIDKEGEVQVTAKMGEFGNMFNNICDAFNHPPGATEVLAAEESVEQAQDLFKDKEAAVQQAEESVKQAEDLFEQALLTGDEAIVEAATEHIREVKRAAEAAEAERKKAEAELQRAEDTLEQVDQLQQDPMCAIKNMTNKLMAQYAEAERCSQSRRVQLLHLKKASRVMLGSAVLHRNLWVRSLVHGWRCEQQLSHARCLARMLHLQSKVQSRAALAELNTGNARASLHLSIQAKKTEKVKAKFKKKVEENKQAVSAGQDAKVELEQATEALNQQQQQLDQVMELQASQAKQALKLKKTVHQINLQRIVNRLTGAENYRAMSQVHTHSLLTIARNHGKLAGVETTVEKAKEQAKKYKAEVHDLRERSEKIAKRRDAERDDLVARMVALKEQKESMEFDHGNMVEERKVEKGQTKELEDSLAKKKQEAQGLQITLDGARSELENEKDSMRQQVLERFSLRIKSTLGANRSEFTLNLLAIRCWQYQMSSELDGRKHKDTASLESAIRSVDMFHVYQRKSGLQTLLNLWQHRSHELQLRKAHQRGVIAVAVVSIQRYWGQQKASAISEWRSASKALNEYQLRSAHLSTAENQESELEEKLRSARLEMQETTERIEVKHDHTIAMVRALNSVLDKDQQFTVLAKSAITNWRVAHLWDNTGGCSTVELDKLQFEVEQLEAQLAETRELNRELASDKGLDVLLAKVEQLQVEALEIGKQFLDCRHEKEQAQRKLKQALSALKRMKDALPPDVKMMTAAQQECAMVRSRGILVNWEAHVVSRLVMLWQLQSGGIDLSGMEGDLGGMSTGAAVATEDPAARKARLEQEAAAEAAAKAAEEEMEREAENARLAAEGLNSAETALQAALDSGDPAAVEAAKAAVEAAQQAKEEAQTSLNKASEQLQSAEKQKSAVKAAAPKRRGSTKRGGKSSMVAHMVQKKCMGLFALLTVLFMKQRQHGQRLLELIFRWKLHYLSELAGIEIGAGISAEMGAEIKLVRQNSMLTEQELDSAKSELEAARSARMKLKQKCMKLKRQCAQQMLMVWMMLTKDVEERCWHKCYQSIKHWVHNTQRDQNVRLQEKLDTEMQQRQDDRSNFEDQLSSLEAEQKEWFDEKSELEKLNQQLEADTVQLNAEKADLAWQNKSLAENGEQQLEAKVQEHAGRMRLLELMTGIMTARMTRTHDHACVGKTLINWVQNYNSSLLESLKGTSAKTLERMRNMSRSMGLLEEKTANYQQLLEKKKQEIEALVAKSVELEMEQIPALQAHVLELQAADAKLQTEHSELKKQSQHYKSWLGIKLAASYIQKIMTLRKAECLRSFKTNLAGYKVAIRISPTIMGALLTAGTDRVWCARIALPFLHWREVSTRRILNYRLQRQTEHAEKSKEISKEMQNKVDTMLAEQQTVLSDLRFQVEAEVAVLNTKINEQQQTIATKEQERDTHVRRMTKQHHDIQDMHGQVALEQRRRLYAALITMRNFFVRRAMIVLMQRWRANLTAVIDPDSSRNQLQLSLSHGNQLAAEIKRMQSHSEASHEGSSKQTKQVQMMQVREKKMAARGKKVFGLLVFTLWHQISSWQLSSLKQSWQLWHMVARSSAEFRRATAMLQQQQQNLEGGVDQQRQLVEEVKRLKQEATELHQVCVGKDQEARAFEDRLYQVKKDADTRSRQLEESFLDAMKATALNRELLQDKDSDLKKTTQTKNDAVELIGQQKKTITQQQKQEEKLVELYDKASNALTKEQGHSAVFTAAVLKAHYITCKLFGVVKLSHGGRSDNISPDNLPLNNGIDVIRQDELMLREVYHWIKRMNGDRAHLSKHLTAAVAPVMAPSTKAPQYAPIEYSPNVTRTRTPDPIVQRTPEQYAPIVHGGGAAEEPPPRQPFVLQIDNIFERTDTSGTEHSELQVASPVHRMPFQSISEWADEVTSPQRHSLLLNGNSSTPGSKRSSVLRNSNTPERSVASPATRTLTPETPTFTGNKFNALPPIPSPV